MTAVDAAWLAAPALAFFVAAASPGPATLAAAATALARGTRPALALGAGLALGLTAWGALVAAGLGALVMQSPPALATLKLAGGAYLLWLAFGAARSAARPEAPEGREGPAEAWPAFRRGVALNLLNPKAALAWAAVIALGLPDGEAAGARLAVIVATCAALGLATYVAIALAFSRAAARAAYARSRRAVEGAVAALFAAAGLRLLLDRSVAVP